MLNLRISALCILNKTLTSGINNIQGQWAGEASHRLLHVSPQLGNATCRIINNPSKKHTRTRARALTHECLFKWFVMTFSNSGALEFIGWWGRDSVRAHGAQGDNIRARIKHTWRLTLRRRCPPVWRWCCPLIQNPRSWLELLQVQGITI